VRLFTESCLSDTDNIALFENTTPINLINLLLCVFFKYFDIFWLIRVVFSNDTMLSVSDKYDSVNERTQEISELMKLHIILGVWQNAHEIY